MRLAFTLVATGVALAVCGCSGVVADPTPSPDTGFTIVAIGDSIAYNPSDQCPGCTGFVDAYGAAIAEQNDADPDVEVRNLSQYADSQTLDVLEEVSSGDLDDALDGADVVIVSVGLNNQPPYTLPEEPCSGVRESFDDAIDLILAATADCIAQQTAVVQADYRELLEAIDARAPDARILALTAHNAWAGFQDLESLGPEVATQVNATMAISLAAWRDVVCAEAAEVGGMCIDVLEAFNGPDSANPAGTLLSASDYWHPSQAGNDVILDLLLAADASN